MRCELRCRMFVGWLVAALAATAGFGVRPAHPSGPNATTSAPADDECERLQARLADSEKTLTEGGNLLRGQLEEVATALESLEAQGESLPASELARRKEELLADQAALQDELKFLELSKTAWQAALDACESAVRFGQQLEQFRAGEQREVAEFVSSDVAAIQAQLSQLQSARAALEEPESVRAERLAELGEQIENADPRAKRLLQAERSALLAETESTRQKRAVLDAETALLDARLAAASEAVGDPATAQPATAPALPAGDEADALNKQRLAEQLEAEARDRLGYVRDRLEEIEARLAEAARAGLDAARLENERELLQRVEGYEQRRLKQAELQTRAAQEKKAIAQLRDGIDERRKSLEQLHQTVAKMPLEEKEEGAARHKELADAAVAEASALEQRAEAEGKEIEPLQQHLPSLDAIQQALDERLQQAVSFADYQRLAMHARAMREQLDAERQQIDLMVVRVENIVFAITLRATLQRSLAELHTQWAEVLVPPEPSFWERNRAIINSIKIVAAAAAITYALKLALWLIRYLVAFLNTTLHRARFSMKRISTLLSFAGSIIKLFVWVFAVVWVLNEFGIEPAKSTGALGLIGLIMAGMFQQIVVDFVKGLDIIAGRHYNVGDFVEVDGKHGHVVDFNVKHTRIRTFSGQEFNIPNSRCVPSRRFPDGYVNNYVDVTLKSSADQDRAKQAIDAVCPDLNQRIEPIREEPALARKFIGSNGRITLRYRLRVLPGCDWVVTDYFIPGVKEALAAAGIEPAAEPTFFFINRIETFRKLFSRRLTEEEIVREVAQAGPGATAGDEAPQAATPDPNVASRSDRHA